jgi:lysophospholipase L1-like esterase
MPLGDSITQADNNHNSFRRPLWQRLKAAGFDVDFVGNQRHHHRGQAPNDDFDQDHEGHWGWRTDEILTKLERWASAHRPDAVLIHLGSNDIFQGQSIQSTVDELAEIVSLLRRVNREVVILVAQIIPTSNERMNREIRKFNGAIALLGLHLDSLQSPVRVVDQHSGFTASEDTYDGTHPNELGEEKMAALWQDILVEYIE